MSMVDAMRFGLIALAWAAAVSFPSSVVAEPLPDSAAGKVLEARLAAMASGSADQLAQYRTQHEPGLDVDRELAFHRATGGFDVL